MPSRMAFFMSKQVDFVRGEILDSLRDDGGIAVWREGGKFKIATLTDNQVDELTASQLFQMAQELLVACTEGMKEK